MKRNAEDLKPGDLVAEWPIPREVFDAYPDGAGVVVKLVVDGSVVSFRYSLGAQVTVTA